MNKNSRKFFRICFALFVLLRCPAPAAAQALAPPFTLKDAAGRARTLKAFRGQPVALFFFCPCAECHRVAELWSQTQAGEDDRPKTETAAAPETARPIATIVVFAGEAADATRFAAETGLDATQAILLCDPDSAVAQKYDAIPCPRVFALGADGKTRYTNRLPNAKVSETAPVPVVTRTREALAVPKPAPLKLTLRTEKGLELTDSATGRFDCGAIDPIATPRIEREFTLRNDTKQPLTINRLKTSCGCESATFLRGGKTQPRPEQQPAILAPGESAMVRLAVSIAGQQGYAKHASLWVYGKESAAALAEVEVVAQIEPSVLFDPPVLRFGASVAKSRQTVQFTAAFDPRLVAAGQINVTSSNPCVAAAAEPGERTEKRGEKTFVVRSFHATLLPDAPAGRISGSLSFALPGADSTAPAVTLPFTAERGGTFAASPALVMFGSLTAGREVKRVALLTAAASDTLTTAKLTSDSPFLTLHAAAPETVGAGAALRVEIILSASAPSGAFSAHVTIETKSGEKLVVPVIAQIEKAAAPAARGK